MVRGGGEQRPRRVRRPPRDPQHPPRDGDHQQGGPPGRRAPGRPLDAHQRPAAEGDLRRGRPRRREGGKGDLSPHRAVSQGARGFPGGAGLPVFRRDRPGKAGTQNGSRHSPDRGIVQGPIPDREDGGGPVVARGRGASRGVLPPEDAHHGGGRPRGARRGLQGEGAGELAGRAC